MTGAGSTLLSIDNTTFAQNNGVNGSALNLDGVALTGSHMRFISNTASETAPCIFARSTSLLSTIVQSTFSSNSAGRAGCIVAANAAISVSNSTFTGNTALSGARLFSAEQGGNIAIHSDVIGLADSSGSALDMASYSGGSLALVRAVSGAQIFSISQVAIGVDSTLRIFAETTIGSLGNVPRGATLFFGSNNVTVLRSASFSQCSIVGNKQGTLVFPPASEIVINGVAHTTAQLVSQGHTVLLGTNEWANSSWIFEASSSLTEFGAADSRVAFQDSTTRLSSLLCRNQASIVAYVSVSGSAAFGGVHLGLAASTNISIRVPKRPGSAILHECFASTPNTTAQIAGTIYLLFDDTLRYADAPIHVNSIGLFKGDLPSVNGPLTLVNMEVSMRYSLSSATGYPVLLLLEGIGPSTMELGRQASLLRIGFPFSFNFSDPAVLDATCDTVFAPSTLAIFGQSTQCTWFNSSTLHVRPARLPPSTQQIQFRQPSPLISYDWGLRVVPTTLPSYRLSTPELLFPVSIFSVGGPTPEDISVPLCHPVDYEISNVQGCGAFGLLVEWGAQNTTLSNYLASFTNKTRMSIPPALRPLSSTVLNLYVACDVVDPIQSVSLRPGSILRLISAANVAAHPRPFIRSRSLLSRTVSPYDPIVLEVQVEMPCDGVATQNATVVAWQYGPLSDMFSVDIDSLVGSNSTRLELPVGTFDVPPVGEQYVYNLRVLARAYYTDGATALSSQTFTIIVQDDRTPLRFSPFDTVAPSTSISVTQPFGSAFVGPIMYRYSLLACGTRNSLAQHHFDAGYLRRWDEARLPSSCGYGRFGEASYTPQIGPWLSTFNSSQFSFVDYPGGDDTDTSFYVAAQAYSGSFPQYIHGVGTARLAIAGAVWPNVLSATLSHSPFHVASTALSVMSTSISTSAPYPGNFLFVKNAAVSAGSAVGVSSVLIPGDFFAPGDLVTIVYSPGSSPREVPVIFASLPFGGRIEAEQVPGIDQNNRRWRFIAPEWQAPHGQLLFMFSIVTSTLGEVALNHPSPHNLIEVILPWLPSNDATIGVKVEVIDRFHQSVFASMNITTAAASQEVVPFATTYGSILRAGYIGEYHKARVLLLDAVSRFLINPDPSVGLPLYRDLGFDALEFLSSTFGLSLQSCRSFYLRVTSLLFSRTGEIEADAFNRGQAFFTACVSHLRSEPSHSHLSPSVSSLGKSYVAQLLETSSSFRRSISRASSTSITVSQRAALAPQALTFVFSILDFIRAAAGPSSTPVLIETSALSVFFRRAPGSAINGVRTQAGAANVTITALLSSTNYNFSAVLWNGLGEYPPAIALNASLVASSQVLSVRLDPLPSIVAVDVDFPGAISPIPETTDPSACALFNGASWDTSPCLLSTATAGIIRCSCTKTGDVAVVFMAPAPPVFVAGPTDPNQVIGGLSGGAIAAIVVVAIVLVAALVILAILLVRRRNAPKSEWETYLANEVSQNHAAQSATAFNLKSSDLKIGQKLGEGSYGAVYLGEYKGSPVAVKRLIAAQLGAQVGAFFQEAVLMMSLESHPNVCKVFGLCQEQQNLSMVMEVINGGALDSQLRKGRLDRANTDLVMHIAIGMAEGMASLAKQGIIHRDLAARNILLTDEFPPTPKVSDFGYARALTNAGDVGQTNSNVGTIALFSSRSSFSCLMLFSGPIRWMAPEAIGERQYSEKSDVWSFGCTLFELLTAKEPWEGQDLISVGVKVRANSLAGCRGLQLLQIRDEGMHPEIPEKGPKPILKVLKLCFKKDPGLRPTFAEIVAILKDETTPKGGGWNSADLDRTKSKRMTNYVEMEDMPKDLT